MLQPLDYVVLGVLFLLVIIIIIYLIKHPNKTCVGCNYYKDCNNKIKDEKCDKNKK